MWVDSQDNGFSFYLDKCLTLTMLYLYLQAQAAPISHTQNHTLMAITSIISNLSEELWVKHFMMVTYWMHFSPQHFTNTSSDSL